MRLDRGLARAAVVAVGLFLAIIGVGGLWLAATRSEGRVTNLAVGAFITSVAGVMLAGAQPRRAGWRRDPDSSGWVLPLAGSRGPLWSAALVCTTSGAVAVLVATVADRTGGRVVAGAVSAFMLGLAVELWRGVARRPRLVLTRDRVRLRGPGVDAEIAWDDVATVEYVAPGTRWAAVSLVAAGDAASYRSATSRLVLAMDRRPDPPGLEVRLGLVPDAPALVRVLRTLHAALPDRRGALLERGLPDDVGADERR